MIIARIQPQKRSKGRFNIYTENGYYCSLSEDTLVKYSLSAGSDIDEVKLNEIRRFDEYLYGKKVAFDMLASRMRSISEIRNKLKTKKLSDDVISDVIDHLLKMGLVDDEVFAINFATEKYQKKLLGRKAVMKKLYEKGISGDISRNVLEKIYSPEEEENLAIQNLMKYLSRLKSSDIMIRKRKAYDYLIRKGFDGDTVIKVISENIKD
ncbi:MAG: RecX family transcriptional regulator [Ignavibacteria bacterium]|nr:RecX family transcriptional regulator [Ignavibacteria bacterium]